MSISIDINDNSSLNNISFQSTSLDDLNYQDKRLTFDDLDSIPEIISLLAQWLFGSLILLLGIPFSPTFAVGYYENVGRTDPLTFTYDRYWVGIVFLGVISLFTILFLVHKVESWQIAIVRVLISLLYFFLIATIMNSLWMYGEFVYLGYFISIPYFFSSDIIVSIIYGILSVGISAYFPVKSKKNQQLSFLTRYCNDQHVCQFPGYEQIQLIPQSKK